MEKIDSNLKKYIFNFVSQTLFNEIEEDVKELRHLSNINISEIGKITITLKNKVDDEVGTTEDVVLNLIDFAIETNEPIFITSYILNYQKIVQKLEAAIDELPGKIYIITSFDKTQVYEEISTSSDNILEDMKNHETVLQRLYKKGIQIRGSNFIHLKMIIVGEKKALITSANITIPAYTKNPEIGILIADHVLIKILRRIFSELWFHHTDYRIRGNEYVKVTPESIHNIGFPSKSELGTISHMGVYFNNSSNKILNQQNEQSLFSLIKSTISQANESLDILIYKLTNTQIINLLKEKLNTNPNFRVRIILPLLKSRSPYIRNKISDLKNNDRVEIYYYKETHAKVLIADSKIAILMTGNLDEHLDDSFDIAIKSSNIEFVNGLKKIYDILLQESVDIIPRLFSNVIVDFYGIIDIFSPYEVYPLVRQTLEDLVKKWKNRYLHLDEHESLAVIKSGVDESSFLHLKKIGNENHYKVISPKEGRYFYTNNSPFYTKSILYNGFIEFRWNEEIDPYS